MTTTDRVTTSEPGSSCWAVVPCTGPNFRHTRYHDFKGKQFHSSRWDYDYTAAHHAVGSTSCATNASP